MCRFIALILLLCLFAFPLSATDYGQEQERSNRIVLGAGMTNPQKYNNQDQSASVHADLRFDEIDWGYVHPFVGFQMNDEGTTWAGAGVESDIDLSDRWITTIQLGAGYFDDGVELRDGSYPQSSPMFRSRLELAYKMENGARIGTYIMHFSNLGLFSDDNQGLEDIGLNVQVPFNWLAD